MAQSGGDLHRRLSDLAAAAAQQSARNPRGQPARKRVEVPVDVFSEAAQASAAYAHAPRSRPLQAGASVVPSVALPSPRSRSRSAPAAAFPAPYSGRTLGGG